MANQSVTDVVVAKHVARIKQLESQVKDLQDRVQGSKVRIDVEKEHLKSAVSTLQKDLKKHLLRERKEQEYVSQVVASVIALDELPRVPAVASKKAKNPMSVIFHATDWHIGEVISKSETDGWGGFNWEKAQDRVLNQLMPRFLHWLNAQRSGYIIDEIVLLETGDFVSGDIHDELRRTNEFPLPEQTTHAAKLLSTVGQELARHCDKLRVIQIGADNHSRLVQKPQAKQKARNSMGSLVYDLQQAYMAQVSNATFEKPDTMKYQFKIRNTAFLGEHGDTVKSWMGVPYYGMEREAAREATRRMFNERGFHHMIMGHWHKRVFGDIIVGGALSGTSEYDHSCGRVSKPHQTAMLVGKRGVFNFVPFELE